MGSLAYLWDQLWISWQLWNQKIWGEWTASGWEGQQGLWGGQLRVFEKDRGGFATTPLDPFPNGFWLPSTTSTLPSSSLKSKYHLILRIFKVATIIFLSIIIIITSSTSWSEAGLHPNPSLPFSFLNVSHPPPSVMVVHHHLTVKIIIININITSHPSPPTS